MSSMTNNDLKDHVLATVSVDQYKSKLGKDENVVVLAVHVKVKLEKYGNGVFIGPCISTDTTIEENLLLNYCQTNSYH